MCRAAPVYSSHQDCQRTVPASGSHHQQYTRSRHRRMQRLRSVNNMLHQAILGSTHSESCTRLPIRIPLNSLRRPIKLSIQMREGHVIISESPVPIGSSISPSPPETVPDQIHGTASQGNHDDISVPIYGDRTDMDRFLSFVDLIC